MNNFEAVSVRINRLICRIPTAFFLFIIGSTVILRNGFGIFGPSWNNVKNDVPGFQWGTPSDYRSSPLIVFLRELCGANPLIWYLQQALITATIAFVVLVLFFYLQKRDPLFARICLVLISLSPTTTILVRTVGNYDPLLYLFVLLGICFGKKKNPLTMGMLWGLCHAEASVLAGISLLVFRRTFALESEWRPRFELFARSAMASGFVVLLVFLPFGGSSRLEISSQFIPISLSSFLYSFPQSVYACLGGIWPIAILYFFAQTRKNFSWWRNLFSFIFPIVTALGCQAITADGTRVAISVLAPFTLIVIWEWSATKELRENSIPLAIALFTPAILVQNIWIHPSFRQLVEYLNLPLEKS